MNHMVLSITMANITSPTSIILQGPIGTRFIGDILPAMTLFIGMMCRKLSFRERIQYLLMVSGLAVLHSIKMEFPYWFTRLVTGAKCETRASLLHIRRTLKILI